MTGFGNSAPRGRRAVPRTQAPLIVELSVGAAKHSATLHEISRTGAKLSDVHSFEAGQEVTFRAGNVHALAEVVWSEGKKCAIAFDNPISVAEVGRLRTLASFVTSATSSRSSRGAVPEL